MPRHTSVAVRFWAHDLLFLAAAKTLSAECGHARQRGAQGQSCRCVVNAEPARSSFLECARASDRAVAISIGLPRRQTSEVTSGLHDPKVVSEIASDTLPQVGRWKTRIS